MKWQTWRDVKEIKKVIETYAKLHPGKTRGNLWNMIVEDYFLRFTSSEYTNSLNHLVKEGIIYSPTVRKTYRLNDNCVIYHA